MSDTIRNFRCLAWAACLLCSFLPGLLSVPPKSIRPPDSAFARPQAAPPSEERRQDASPNHREKP